MAKKDSSRMNSMKSKISKPQTLRTLIVEDSEDDALLLIRALKKNGYDPLYERVENAAAMKKALREKPWDIILCDYKMPAFSAQQAIALLKKIKSDIPAIIVSGNISEEMAIECMRSGAHDYIMKSNLSRLCPAIKRELAEAKIRRKQKLMEEKLRQEQQRFRALAEQSSDIIVLLNREGNILYENSVVERILGFKPEERIGRKIFEKIHPEDWVRISGIYNKLFEDENFTASQKEEVRIRHQDGNWRTFEIVGNNLVNNNIVEAVIVNLRDITRRKQAEEDLRESERKYKLVAEKINDIVWITDKDFNIIYVTPSIYNVLGFTQEETKNNTPEEKLTPESLAYFRKILAQELAVGEKGHGCSDGTFSMELECYHKDGSTRWMEAVISRICDKQGVMTGLHGVSRDITKRKQVEEYLRASEDKFVKAFRYSPTAMCISTIREGRFIDANHVFLDTLGYKREEVIGRTSTDINLWVNTAERDVMLQELLNTGKIVNIELQLHDQQGNILSGLASMSLIKFAGEMHILTQTMNITDRKLAEEALRQSEERYRTILDDMDEGYEESDLKGNYTFVNDAFQRILDYSSDELIGTNFKQYTADEETKKKIIRAYNEIYKTGIPLKRNLEWNIIRKDGTIRTCEFFASLLKDSDGVPVGFRGIGRDITDRKEVQNKLRENEERIQRITKCVPDLIWAMDLSGRLIYANEAVERTHGWTVDEFLNLSLRDVVSPLQFSRDAGMLEEALAEAVKPDYNRNKVITFESEELRRDGSTFWAEVSTSFLWSDDDKPIGIIGVTRDITERKRTEKALREKDEILLGITKNLPGNIYQFYAKDSGEYGMSYISDPLNENAKIMLSMETENLEEAFPAFLARIHEEDRERFLASIKKAVETVTPWNYEGRVLHRGKVVWFQGMSVPTRDQDRTVFDGILLNITERKLAEEKSRESEEKFHKIFMTNPNSIGIARLSDGLLLDANKRFEDVLGWKREAVIGIKSADWPHSFWVDFSERDFMVKELKAGRDVQFRDFKFRRSDGRIRFGIYSARAIIIDNEECLIFILQDITERKLAEEKFYKIYMTTPNCIAITRLKDGLITDINKGFEDMLGWRREEVIGTKSTEAPMNFWVDLSVRDDMAAEIKARKNVLHREFKFRRKDGSVRDGIFSARLIIIDNEDCLIFILQDVTEQKRMEKELVESHKTSVMSQIASGVAHEVRNPLHAIQAISEAMALDLDENPDYKDYLMHIKAQVGRLSHLMNDLLDLGKPIKSSQFSRASLTEIVTAAVGYLREGQAERLQQIKIVNRLSSDNMVLVDTNKIQQVIINLVDNAIQHSPRDGEILLEIGKADKNFMMIKVIDRGDGLKSEDQHRIFEPFYTTRKSGTGLGMSLCKHIIDSHGGSIDITNNQNAPGCTAQFTIPVYKSKEYE